MLLLPLMPTMPLLGVQNRSAHSEVPNSVIPCWQPVGLSSGWTGEKTVMCLFRQPFVLLIGQFPDILPWLYFERVITYSFMWVFVLNSSFTLKRQFRPTSTHSGLSNAEQVDLWNQVSNDVAWCIIWKAIAETMVKHVKTYSKNELKTQEIPRFTNAFLA